MSSSREDHNPFSPQDVVDDFDDDQKFTDNDFTFEETIDETYEEAELIPAAASGWRNVFGRIKDAAGSTLSATGHGLKTAASFGAAKVKDVILYVRYHPISTLISTTAASVNGLNALTAPADINPADLGTKWWMDMSNFKRIYSLASALSSFTINTIMNARFIPQAAQKLKTSLSDMRKGCGKILLNTVSIGLGLGSGVAQASIAYSAYLWLPLGWVTAIPIALLAGIVTFAGRYLSIKSIISRIMTLFNANARLQSMYADLMERFNTRYLDLLQAKLDKTLTRLFVDHDPNQPLTEDEHQELIRQFSITLRKLSRKHPDLIRTPTSKDYIAKYAGLFADVTMAVFCSTAGFITFDQKGFEGVNKVATLTGHSLDTLHPGWRGLIGAAPGLASFMFFGNHALEIRRTMTDLIIHLYHNPRSFPSALILLAMNGIGSNSMKAVGQGIVNNTNNLFGLTKNTFGTAYIYLITLAGAVGNGNSILKSFIAKPEPAIKDLKIEHVTRHLSSVDDHPISDETASALRRNSLFIYPPSRRAIHTPVQLDNRPTPERTYDNQFVL